MIDIRRRTATAVLCATAAAGLLGCSGKDEPRPTGNGTPSATAAATPTATEGASAAPTATRRPTPTPTPGIELTTNGAYLNAARGEAVAADPGAGCEGSYEGLLDVSCDTIKLDGGTALWLAGTEDDGSGTGARRWVLRLLTPRGPGWAPVFEARDRSGTWSGFLVGAARLTGKGVDALVVQTSMTDTRRGYDVLTWRKGGPLVLRAHRPAGLELRVQYRDGVLVDYERADGKWFRRTVKWDGLRFRYTYERVAASEVPAS